jgi:MFS family permease
MALALLPTGLLVALSAPFAGTMIDRFGTSRFIVGGLAAMSAGYVLFLRIDTHPVYVVAILPTAILLGVGFALGFPSINVQATAGVSDDEQGLAAGLVQTAGQVGAALVLAITTAIISSDATPAHSAAGVLDEYRPGLVFATFVAVGGLAMALVPFVIRRRAVALATEER